MEMVNSVGKCIQRKNVDWFDLEPLEGMVDDILSRLPVKCLLNPIGRGPRHWVAFGPEISEYKVFRFFRSKSDSVIVQPDPEEDNHDIPGSILAVDMEEHFETISLPDTLTELSFLIDFEGCLSVVAVNDIEEPVVIWILKNENESVWEKKCSAGIPYGGMMEDLHSVAARESDIFFITAHFYVILDTYDSSWGVVDFPVFEPNAHAVFPYTESLLPCSGRFAGEEEQSKRSMILVLIVRSVSSLPD
ncbi:hypothetical protein M0R45_015120 [Rubus argutus]|uniref:F-box associated domain-containing protein n=1 Tax=Rubus argutus TaxID=59490 RepID=A0AAW1XP87_RUBAR